MATVAAGLSVAQPLPLRLPRSLHPLAWWLWALGLATAASRTTNPLVLGGVIAVAVWVVLARRPDTPWSSAFRLYLLGGVLVVALRVVFRVVFAGNQGSVVLLPLPTLTLPGGGELAVFGDVTAESLLTGVYDGLRLATMLICLGAANAVANPRRLLRCLPAALHEVSTAVVVALSVFPQLAESLVRVRRARRLRPAPTGSRVAKLRAVVLPVLEDALERSMQLAASMDSRGYGRRGHRSQRAARFAGSLLVLGLAGLAVGVYALLDTTAPRYLATPFLVTGSAVGFIGIALAGRGVTRSAYRPDSWRTADVVTACSGLAAAYVMSVAAPALLHPPLTPLEWPQLAVQPTLGLLVALLPLLAAPPPLGRP